MKTTTEAMMQARQILESLDKVEQEYNKKSQRLILKLYKETSHNVNDNQDYGIRLHCIKEIIDKVDCKPHNNKYTFQRLSNKQKRIIRKLLTNTYYRYGHFTKNNKKLKFLLGNVIDFDNEVNT